MSRDFHFGESTCTVFCCFKGKGMLALSLTSSVVEMIDSDDVQSQVLAPKRKVQWAGCSFSNYLNYKLVEIFNSNFTQRFCNYYKVHLSKPHEVLL